MSEHLLSLLHIQKLGHPIEEIRLRALGSVISKYNLNLVDESNIENTKLLIEKLLNWFDFDKYGDEKKVLTLLLRILKYKNVDMILKEIDRKNLLKRLKEIQSKISCEYESLVKDIIKIVVGVQDEIEDNFRLDNIYTDRSELVNGTTCTDYSELNKNIYSTSSRETKSVKSEEIYDKKIENNFTRKALYKVEFFPWQHLTPGDKQVLSSVYDGLRYYDKKNSILQSCQFYNEVLLRDFPTEIFIQRPLIVRIFLQLIECTEEDVRVTIIKCLINTVKNLRESMYAALDSQLFHLKKEFYTTSVFLNLLGECETLAENFNLSAVSCDDNLQFEDCGDIDPNIKKHQLSVPQFCYEILLQILPHLGKKCSLEEANSLICLSFTTLNCIILNLNSEVWPYTEAVNVFYKIFGKLYEVLKYQKTNNQVIYMILLYFIIKLLNLIKPPSGIELSEILVGGLQSELSACISDSVLVLLFPQLHLEIFKYVEKLIGKKEKESVQDHKDALSILKSMNSTIKYLKNNGKLKTKLEKLQCMYDSLPSLDFHQNLKLINFFVTSCLLKWRKSQLKDEELKLREVILLKLLAHSNDVIKIFIYKEIHGHTMKLLGVEETNIPRFEFPGDKMDFLFQTPILNEMICYGLTSSITEVRKYTHEILCNLLKSKFIISDICWSDFMNSLIPCLSLLQCFGDKSTILGRCVVKMFDPDVAKSTGLPQLDVLKGNMRFLFSKNNLTRDEAISRLFWLLSKEDLDSRKLPRISVLTGLNLSGICSCVKPQEFEKVRHSFYSPGRLCDVLDMLNSTVEESLQRSALSQISVMMDDTHLHPVFLEQKGLERILQILDDCLIEKKNRCFKDSIKPIIDILKALAFHNVSVRQELSCQVNVMFNILRGLFLFSNDNTLRQNAVELLCLLLYNECILRVSSNSSSRRSISLPQLVVDRMCLPFTTHIHGRISTHLEPSIKKSFMSKENCSKLIRTSWAILWVGSISDLLAIQPCDLQEKVFSPGIPNDMKITMEDLESIRNCNFSLSVKQTLYSIQNATTHKAVLVSLHKLHSYLLLYNVDKMINGKKSNDIGSDTALSHMLWESTLERFMTAQPSCIQDEELLLQVIQLVQLLLRSFNSERLINWVEKFLIDEHQPLICLLRSIGNENFGLVGKELRLGVVDLAREIVTLKISLDRNKWFIYLELISTHLKLEKKNEFYNVAYVDWFLSLLVQLTGNWSWDFTNKTEFLEHLIVRIVEIIIALHCTKDSAVSFMGYNIIRNSLIVLNNIIVSSQQFVKGWEKLWFRALSKVIGHERYANYYWMLSLWFMRDPATRSAAYALFVSFSATSLSCELLIDQLNIQFDHIWSQTFRVLFDENECSIVREKAGYLLSNLTNQGTKASVGSFLEHLKGINFYHEIFKIISNYNCEPTLSEVRLHESVNSFSGVVPVAPSLVTSVCILLMRVLALNPTQVAQQLLDHNVFASLMTVLGDVPESASAYGKHHDCYDIIQMYITVCRLLIRSVKSNCSVLEFVLQSQPSINYFFSMINYNLYCDESKLITSVKEELWSEIFDLFSALLTYNSKCSKELVRQQSTGFILINKCITDNGIDYFISSLYIAMTSSDISLKYAVYKFLINLFRLELTTPKHLSIADILDRKISNKALKIAMTNGWKPFSISESLTLSFGVRAADILMQVYTLSSSFSAPGCKTTISDSLGSLLAVCKSAQDFCIQKNLQDTIILTLKQICVKLNLETVENLKRTSGRKKIDPIINDCESLFKLICNLVIGNEKAKSVIADCALSAVVHKLWPWCMAKRSLLIVALKMLCTFTHSCDQACRTLVLSGSLNMLGLKKSPGSVTLINSVMTQVTLEMDSISDSHDPQVLRLCLQLLTNSCRVAECRSVLSKGNFLQCFTKLHPNRKKKCYTDSVIESWLRFLIAFSTYQDGQLILTKGQDILELLLLKCNSSKSSNRIRALSILRNICFNHLNRVRMLGWYEFLSLLFETLGSKVSEEVQIVAVTIWALTANSQKAKQIIRTAGFEAKLACTKRQCIITEDMETADLIEVVLGILKNK